MFKTFANVFKITELRNKLLFTIGLLCVYRIGFYIPIPGVDAKNLEAAGKLGGSVFGAISNYLSMFSGGSLSQSTIFGLGIMPYISASIILQLLATVYPPLEKLRKEGEPGTRKINEWTRYLTVLICLIQGAIYVRQLVAKTGNDSLVLHSVNATAGAELLFIVMALSVLTAGSVFLMWLGEQIDAYGIGNGVSLIITAGILSRMPLAIGDVYKNATISLSNTDTGKYSPPKIAFLVFCFIFVVAGSILLTEGQRRIRIQQAKHMRGRRVYGGQVQYLPLRVNHAGVMPIIFASSLMLLPGVLLGMVQGQWANSAGDAFNHIMSYLVKGFSPGQYPYEVIYVAMIFFFSYFWNTVQFQPKEIANQLRDYGSFIPGLRPGKRTADYLEAVVARITYVGAAFLAVIAVVPSIISTQMGVNYQITQFLGGTGLLIVISVMLDFISRIEANLVMRDYGGFSDRDEGTGPGSVRRKPKSGNGGSTVRGNAA